VTRPLAVRPAQLDDLPVVVELRFALLREYHEHPLNANLRPDAMARASELYRNQLASPYETILLAERGDRVVGILRCVDTPSSPLMLPERYCYLSSAYVRPGERHRGVLRALLDAAEDWCEARGLTEMRLHNAAASSLAAQAWGALGFEIVEHVRRRALPVRRGPAARSRAGAGAV
jgi:GNAT superfamily N-acetyltransferase